MNSYFSLNEKVYDVTEEYPPVLDLLISKGFDNLRNTAMRKTLGRTITVEQALRMKKIDLDLFEEQVEAVLGDRKLRLSDGLTQAQFQSTTAQFSIEGVLPCPVKLQLLEKFEAFIGEENLEVNMDLQSASLGLNHIIDKVRSAQSENDLADIYMSAGFNLFFDKNLIGRWMDQGVFKDLSGWERLNPVFQNARINLRDPRGQYSIIGVVPAVLVVNTKLLGDRPMPKSWADILKPEFKNSLSLPVKDLDMFDAVMLGFYKLFGYEGIRKLGENLLEGMHPAQMVKGAKSHQGIAPAVSIAPYFFAMMAKENGPIQCIWPEEGALISPIFLITKASARERIRKAVEFLYSREIAEIIYVDGRFPSTNPDLDNRLTEAQKFVWIGWDMIYNEDTSEILRKAEEALSGEPTIRIGGHA